MDKSTSIGIGAGLVLIYGCIFLDSGWATFFDLISIIIVGGGTVAALLATHSFDELKQVPVGLKRFFSYRSQDLSTYLATFTEYSRVARREGLLALDRRLGDEPDAFVRFGLELAIDGIDETEIDELMKLRITAEAKQRQLLSKIFVNAGTYAPAFGMLGTLIGLIQMMQNMTDPSQIGSGMAVALVTTFYGALLANLIFLPLSSKLKTQATELVRARQMVHAGVLSIVRGDSPSMIEKRLQSFLVEEDHRKNTPAAEAPPLSRAA